MVVLRNEDDARAFLAQLKHGNQVLIEQINRLEALLDMNRLAQAEIERKFGLSGQPPLFEA